MRTATVRQAILLALALTAGALLPVWAAQGAPSALDSSLAGTVVVEGGRSLALFQPGDGLVLVREGDEIAAGLRLVEVRREGVVVEQDGARRQVLLRSGGAPDESITTEPGVASEPVRKIGDATWRVDREGVKRANQGLGRVLAQIQLASHSAEGRPDGVEFTFVGEGGLFNQLGFQPGDVVRRINGLETKTVDQTYQAYEAAAEGPMVRVEVVRDGRSQTFTYQLR